MASRMTAYAATVGQLPFDQEDRATVPEGRHVSSEFLACRFAHRGPVPPTFASAGLRPDPYPRKDRRPDRFEDVTRWERST